MAEGRLGGGIMWAAVATTNLNLKGILFKFIFFTKWGNDTE